MINKYFEIMDALPCVHDLAMESLTPVICNYIMLLQEQLVAIVEDKDLMELDDAFALCSVIRFHNVSTGKVDIMEFSRKLLDIYHDRVDFDEKIFPIDLMESMMLINPFKNVDSPPTKGKIAKSE